MGHEIACAKLHTLCFCVGLGEGPEPCFHEWEKMSVAIDVPSSYRI